MLTRFYIFSESREYLPNLSKRLVYKHFITPDYFENTLNSYLGNGFGVEPRLIHSAFFRPHNKSEDIKNLYLVGQGTQPGGGTPSVMISAKMTARVIAKDFGIDSSHQSLPSAKTSSEPLVQDKLVSIGDQTS